jgi:hypothetical protein
VRPHVESAGRTHQQAGDGDDAAAPVLDRADTGKGCPAGVDHFVRGAKSSGRRKKDTVSGNFADVEKWLPESRLLITYVAGPYPDEVTTPLRR